MTETAQKPATPVTIYTDGACRGNPGEGAWAAILTAGTHTKEISGYKAETTNNQMELTAVISALSALKRPCDVNLYTDSEYVLKGMTQWIAGWKKRNWKNSAGAPVKNRELWQALEAAAAPHTISWHWVKGHNGHPGNERADTLANEAIDRKAGIA